MYAVATLELLDHAFTSPSKRLDIIAGAPGSTTHEGEAVVLSRVTLYSLGGFALPAEALRPWIRSTYRLPKAPSTGWMSLSYFLNDSDNVSSILRKRPSSSRGAPTEPSSCDRPGCYYHPSGPLTTRSQEKAIRRCRQDITGHRERIFRCVSTSQVVFGRYRSNTTRYVCFELTLITFTITDQE